MMQPGDADFPSSGLHRTSIIRLSYLHSTDPNEVSGVIGHIDPTRLAGMQARLADHLRP
jgi:hypothetical protein